MKSKAPHNPASSCPDRSQEGCWFRTWPQYATVFRAATSSPIKVSPAPACRKVAWARTWNYSPLVQKGLKVLSSRLLLCGASFHLFCFFFSSPSQLTFLWFISRFSFLLILKKAWSPFFLFLPDLTVSTGLYNPRNQLMNTITHWLLRYWYFNFRIHRPSVLTQKINLISLF